MLVADAGTREQVTFLLIGHESGTRFSANGSVARKKEQFEEERSRCRNVRTSNFCRDVALSV